MVDWSSGSVATTRRSSAPASITTLVDAQLAIAWHSAALLLDHPDEILLGQLESIHRATHLLPDEVGGPLRSTLLHLERADLSQLVQEYVRTFRSADCPGQLAEGLSLVLEHAASAEPPTGHALLRGRRQELERLRTSLQAVESGWAGAVTAVTATLRDAPTTR